MTNWEIGNQIMCNICDELADMEQELDREGTDKQKQLIPLLDSIRMMLGPYVNKLMEPKDGLGMCPELEFGKMSKKEIDKIDEELDVDKDIDPRFRETKFVVEANDCEFLYLWKDFSEQHNKSVLNRKYNFEEDNRGLCYTIGRAGNKPISVTFRWCLIDGFRIMFYYPSSLLVDHEQINSWLERSCTGLWKAYQGNGFCNAMNFHHCLNAIDQEKEKI